MPNIQTNPVATGRKDRSQPSDNTAPVTTRRFARREASFASGAIPQIPPSQLSMRDTAPDLGPPSGTPTSPSIFGATHRGRIRPTNEDHYLISELNRSLRVHSSTVGRERIPTFVSRPHGWLMMVADGVGGRPHGEIASEVAISTLADYAVSLMPWTFVRPGAAAPSLDDGFRHAVEACEREIAEISHAMGADGNGNPRPSPIEPGTTLTAAYVCWPNLFVVHVGDSRCYLYRHGRLYRLTHDHTLREVVGGDVEAPLGDVLLNVVGGAPNDVKPEIRHMALREGDAILLCTDGVHSLLSGEALAGYCALSMNDAEPEVSVSVRAIMEAAYQHGAPDNITAVMAAF